MQRKVLYWQGVAALKDQNFDACKKQIAALLQGDYKTADLDLKRSKQNKYRLYTAKVNDKDRVLFTTVKINGKSHLLLLEMILEHDYQKSKFLNNPALLAAVIAENDFIAEADAHWEESSFAAIETLNQELAEPELSPASSSSPSSASAISPSSSNDFELDHANFYHKQFIILDDSQDNAVATKLPAVIHGLAGSGKSCVAINIIAHAVDLALDGTQGTQHVYLTKSELLTRHMESAWKKYPQAYLADGRPNTTVKFASYEDLMADILKKYYPEKAFIFTGKKDFELWYMNRKPKSALKYSIDELYQEFYICSGASDFAAYSSLGQDNSLAREEDQAEIFKLYSEYKKKGISQLHAKNNEIELNLAFLSLSDLFPGQVLEPIFDTLVIDEAQDLSILQIQVLMQLTRNSQIAILLDPAQSLFAAKSILPTVLDLLWRMQTSSAPKRITPLPLHSTYRCPQAIADAADSVSELRTILRGGTGDKYGISKLQVHASKGSPGLAYWFSEAEDKHIDTLLAKYSATEVVIIAAIGAVCEEAKSRFPGYLVLSIEEAKGLEFEVVLAYKPLEADVFEQANKKVKLEPKAAASSSRPKQGQLDDRFTPAMNALFTTFTRPTQGLLLVQKDKHEISSLMQRLVPHFKDASAMLNLGEGADAHLSTTADWVAKAKKYLIEGMNEVAAKRIFTDILRKTAEEFELFKLQVMPKPTARPEFTLFGSSSTKPVDATPKASHAEIGTPQVKLSSYESKLNKKLANQVTDSKLNTLFKLDRVALLNALFCPGDMGETIFQILIRKENEKLVRSFLQKMHVEKVNNTSIPSPGLVVLNLVYLSPEQLKEDGVKGVDYLRQNHPSLLGLVSEAKRRLASLDSTPPTIETESLVLKILEGPKLLDLICLFDLPPKELGRLLFQHARSGDLHAALSAKAIFPMVNGILSKNGYKSPFIQFLAYYFNRNAELLKELLNSTMKDPSWTNDIPIEMLQREDLFPRAHPSFFRDIAGFGPDILMLLDRRFVNLGEHFISLSNDSSQYGLSVLASKPLCSYLWFCWILKNPSLNILVNLKAFLNHYLSKLRFGEVNVLMTGHGAAILRLAYLEDKTLLQWMRDRIQEAYSASKDIPNGLELTAAWCQALLELEAKFKTEKTSDFSAPPQLPSESELALSADLISKNTPADLITYFTDQGRLARTLFHKNTRGQSFFDTLLTEEYRDSVKKAVFEVHKFLQSPPELVVPALIGLFLLFLDERDRLLYARFVHNTPGWSLVLPLWVMTAEGESKATILLRTGDLMGRKFIDLLNLRPELPKALSAEQFFQTYSDQKPSFSVALTLLLVNPEYITTHRPDLISYLSGPLLNAEMQNQCSLLFALSESFKEIVQVREEILSEVSVTALTRKYGGLYSVFELISHDIPFLIRLDTALGGLAEHLSIDDLTLIYKDAKDHDIMPTMYNLSTSEEGMALWLCWLETNPKLIPGSANLKDLTETLCFESAVTRLLQSETGKKIFKLIIQREPSIHKLLSDHYEALFATPECSLDADIKAKVLEGLKQSKPSLSGPSAMFQPGLDVEVDAPHPKRTL